MSGFTVKPLKWLPYLPPVEVDEATEEQRAAMQVTPSNSKISPYVRTLAHDPESYVARTKLYNLIMYSEGGLAQEYRELAALAASARNGCVYCASVHARRHVTLNGSSDTVREIYLRGFAGGLGPRERAIVDFSRALAETPVAVTKEQVDALVAQGFGRDELVDLVHSAAIFGWANRLMHTLGHAEAMAPAKTANKGQDK